MRIYPGISVINLAVADLASAVRFYERLGFRRSRKDDEPEIALFELNNIVLALRGAPARESTRTPLSTDAPASVSLAQYHPSAAAAAAALKAAGRAGARLLAEKRPAPKGGVQGAFADGDGHVWEVVYDPSYSVAVDGTLCLRP